jgi:hypothetical protein
VTPSTCCSSPGDVALVTELVDRTANSVTKAAHRAMTRQSTGRLNRGDEVRSILRIPHRR